MPILATADDFRSEKLWAFEAGYRGQPTARTQLSVNVFFNRYDDLRTTELTGGTLPIRLDNGLAGNAWGIEAWATHQLLPWWRLRVGAATLKKNFDTKPGHVDLANGESLGNDPNFRLSARSQIDLGRNVELDVGLRMVDELERPAVDSYVEADARLGWLVSERLELFVAGTNLLNKTHDESAYDNGGQLVERSVYAGTRVRF